MSGAAVRDATAADAAAMAALADEKRRRYAEHASPFQRPANDALAIHRAFLPKLLAWDGFVVRVHERAGRVDGFAVARLGSAPPPFGEGSLFHVDDFAVAGDDWRVAGDALLRSLARTAAAAGLETAVVVSGPSSVDPAKCAFLEQRGFHVEAEWWVKAVAPDTGSEPPAPEGFRAVVGPAPPVYDPGGPTCLALAVDDGRALPRLERFAAASGAVLVIVPLRRGRTEIRERLAAGGYVAASEWHAAPVAPLG